MMMMMKMHIKIRSLHVCLRIKMFAYLKGDDCNKHTCIPDVDDDTGIWNDMEKGKMIKSFFLIFIIMLAWINNISWRSLWCAVGQQSFEESKKAYYHFVSKPKGNVKRLIN